MIDNRKVTLGTAVVLTLMGVIVGLGVSKYSAVAAYELGHSIATKNLDREAEIRLTHFEQHRMESCLAWWWKDSYRNLKAAQFYMCQNERKWK